MNKGQNSHSKCDWRFFFSLEFGQENSREQKKKKIKRVYSNICRFPSKKRLRNLLISSLSVQIDARTVTHSFFLFFRYSILIYLNQEIRKWKYLICWSEFPREVRQKWKIYVRFGVFKNFNATWIPSWRIVRNLKLYST